MSELTLLDIDNMSSAELVEKSKDPAFQELLRKLTNPNETPEVATVPTPTVEPPPVVPEAAVVPAAPAEAPEQVFSYQPEDEFGRPMGGRQVIKYRTQDELNAKMVKNSNELLRELRKTKREQRLGLNPEENIPAEAPRLELEKFEKKTLSADERFQLVQDLNDPEKFADASDRLIEASVGIKPEKIREIFTKQQLEQAQIRANQNFQIFVGSTPEFYADAENTKTLTDWMFKNGLAPTVENFQLANSSLKSTGLLIEAPAVRQEPVPTPVVASVEPEVKPQPPVAPESRITPVEQPQAKRHSQVPSGLNERTSSPSGASPVDGLSMTLADIDRLPADDYKARMKDPAFRKMLDTLEKEDAIRRQQRNG